MNGGTEMDVRKKQSSEKRLIDYYYLAEKIECPGEPLVYWNDIEAAPTVEAVEVVHGRWIDAREYCGDYMCSNCEALYGTNKFNYCHNCGAKMNGGADNEH